MQQISDARFGVFVFRAPEERIERTHFNADTAIHAECVVNVETVELVHLARCATGTTWRSKFFVTLDVDTPVGT
jgi:hypothetical protein